MNNRLPLQSDKVDFSVFLLQIRKRFFHQVGKWGKENIQKSLFDHPADVKLFARSCHHFFIIVKSVKDLFIDILIIQFISDTAFFLDLSDNSFT